ncbi:MAG TPA: GNAT family N-acetyltransferase [Pseudonocardiaceae bacterium]|jgi:hypothetical protein
MRELTIRHFTDADIGVRTALLRESSFQANLTDFATLAEDDALVVAQRRTIADEQDSKRIFTVVGGKGQIVGFMWITSIDWRAQVCELSFAVLPDYRSGYGLSANTATLDYLRRELNFEVVINQVLDHNTMFQSGDKLANSSTVVCPYDSYTVGAWRTACYWTQSREEFYASVQRFAARRLARRDRIRAALAEEVPA